MVGFLHNLSSFWGSARDTTSNFIKPFGDRKRKREEDSGGDPGGPASATSLPKRQATPPAKQPQQQLQHHQQPLQNGLSHQHQHLPQANGLPAARQLFSPGYLTEQHRSISSRFPPQQQRPPAQHAVAAQPHTGPSLLHSKLAGPRRQLHSSRLSPPNAGLAASPYTTPAASRTSGSAALANGLGKSPRTNGPLPADTAAAIRYRTRTRDGLTPRRVHGPGAASRRFDVQRHLLVTPGLGNGSMSQQQERRQPDLPPPSAQACQRQLLSSCTGVYTSVKLIMISAGKDRKHWSYYIWRDDAALCMFAHRTGQRQRHCICWSSRPMPLRHRPGDCASR